MIFNLLINTILLAFGMFFSIMPTATIADIPVIGETIVSILEFAVRHWNAVIDTIRAEYTASSRDHPHAQFVLATLHKQFSQR